MGARGTRDLGTRRVVIDALRRWTCGKTCIETHVRRRAVGPARARAGARSASPAPVDGGGEEDARAEREAPAPWALLLPVRLGHGCTIVRRTCRQSFISFSHVRERAGRYTGRSTGGSRAGLTPRLPPWPCGSEPGEAASLETAPGDRETTLL